MQGSYKISVAVCSYNGAKYLPRQLDSILTQTVPPDEIIICDDQSKDQTPEVLKQYAQQYPDIVQIYFNEVNLGYAKNFEKAISLCTGDLIFLSDQDDCWKPHKIETMAQVFLTKPTVGFVYSDAQVVNENLEPAGYTIFQSRTAYNLAKPRTVEQVVHNVDIKGCLTGFRSVHKPLLLPLEAPWMHDHWIALILHAISEVEIVSECLMCYRRHGVNFGADTYLNAMEQGGKVAGQDFYKKSRKKINEFTQANEKVQVMYQKLTSIKNTDSRLVYNKTRLEAYIREYERLLETVVAARKKRIKVLESTGMKRLTLSLQLLSSGAYKRYFQGNFSFLRDLFIA